MLSTKSVLALSLPLLTPLLLGCSDNSLGTDGGSGGDLSTPAMKIPDCVGTCTVNTSCGSSPTTLSGVVTIPSGMLPLYNAKVFIPAGDTLPPPPPTGATCDRCDAVGTAVVTSAVTDYSGKFVLTNVPSGQNIPLIIKVGKWRRVVHLPSITDCINNPLDPMLTHLPRNQSEGNIPKIALSTGAQDALECLLRSKKIGLDDSEFTPEGGKGRVNLYAGGPSPATMTMPMLTPADHYAASLNGGAPFTKVQPQNPPGTPANWWDTASNWLKYDIVMLSCEGQLNSNYKSPAAIANLESYINQGGKVFASHWHNAWLLNAMPPQKLQTVVTFAGNLMQPPDPATETIDVGYSKGQALANWLMLPAVMGSTMQGQLQVGGTKATVMSINTMLSQRWVYYQPMAMAAQTQYFSFNAPIGALAAQQCGQMVFTDLHVTSGTGGDTSTSANGFPNGCVAGMLSPQEKALIFMFFDLTNCLQTTIQ